MLGFIFLFKIGEAFLGRMSVIFYKEIGFSLSDIALYSKGLGWVTTVTFTVLGGLVAIRIGLVRAMFVSGIAMAATNLLFAALAWAGKSELLFAVAVVMDDLTSAFATVTFVAFISMLVDRTYTATQYALLASIGTAGRTLFAASSGALVDWLEGDWGTFFVITTHDGAPLARLPVGDSRPARSHAHRRQGAAVRKGGGRCAGGSCLIASGNRRPERSSNPCRLPDRAFAGFMSEGRRHSALRSTRCRCPRARAMQRARSEFRPPR